MSQTPKTRENVELAVMVLVLAGLAFLFLYPVYERMRARTPLAYVRDGNYQPVPHAAVRFRDTQTGSIVSFTTDAYGSIRWNGLREVPGYWPPRLPPRYELLDYAVVKTPARSVAS